MSPLPQSLQELQNRDRELKSRLAQLGEMRPGSLVECYRKCGKPNCRCARPQDRGHGPLWMVTHALKGRTVSKAIPAGPALERTRAQLAEYQRFRDLSRELVATNEQICNARLEEATEGSASGHKKNGAGRGVGGRGRTRVGSSVGRRRG